LTGERNKKYLIASIWVIVVGIILLFCGVIIGGGMGVIYDIGKWFDASHIMIYTVAIGLAWVGIILFIIGVFGIITALLKGHLDKGQSKVTSAS
jgi:hypothetical protein